MNERELKKYAMIGLLVRVSAEKERLNKATDENEKKKIQKAIETMETEYNTLLFEIM